MVSLSLPKSPPSQHFGLGRTSRVALRRPARKRTFYPDAKSREGMKYSPLPIASLPIATVYHDPTIMA